ncbi:MAG: tyrosine-protein phosphatase [Alphaproteobacteria bacterium]
MSTQSAESPARVLPLEGATNFRDLGGYKTRDGRHTKWRHLYRSNSLAGLTDSDLAHVADLNIKVVCDFRRDEERVENPSRLPDANAPDVIPFSIGPDREESELFKVLQQSNVTEATLGAAMQNAYRAYAQQFTGAYARFMRLCAQADQLPLLFHCAAGKDRTGWGAAILLEALGVDRDTIYHDYELTNQYLVRNLDALAEKYPDMESLEVFHTMLAAHPDYLAAGHKAMEDTFGSFDAYLENGLGFTAEERRTMKDHLLE